MKQKVKPKLQFTDEKSMNTGKRYFYQSGNKLFFKIKKKSGQIVSKYFGKKK